MYIYHEIHYCLCTFLCIHLVYLPRNSLLIVYVLCVKHTLCKKFTTVCMCVCFYSYTLYISTKKFITVCLYMCMFLCIHLIRNSLLFVCVYVFIHTPYISTKKFTTVCLYMCMFLCIHLIRNSLQFVYLYVFMILCVSVIISIGK